jgi:polysaccharide export outer membrane protein
MGTRWTRQPSACIGAFLLIPQLLAAQITTPSEALAYRLRPADTIEINFQFTPEFNQTLLVRPDGFVTLRGVGDALAAGLTIEQFTRAVESRYSGLLREPLVSVVLKDFERPFFLVGGEVERPGKYDLRGRTTIVEAVTIAGGIKRSGKASSVLLYRSAPEGALPSVVVDVKKLLENPAEGAATLAVGHGDLVWVPRTIFSKVERFLPVPSIGLWPPWR